MLMATVSKKFDNIQPELKAFILESIRNVLEDPDLGLGLSSKTVSRLRASKNKKQEYFSQAEVEKRFQ